MFNLGWSLRGIGQQGVHIFTSLDRITSISVKSEMSLWDKMKVSTASLQEALEDTVYFLQLLEATSVPLACGPFLPQRGSLGSDLLCSPLPLLRTPVNDTGHTQLIQDNIPITLSWLATLIPSVSFMSRCHHHKILRVFFCN